MRPEEEASKLAFDQFIRASFDDSNIVWKTEEHDPPDYWLHMNEKVFAVEVTRIFETREINSTEITRLYSVKFLQEMKKEIENKTAAYLSGKYALFCNEPNKNLLLIKQQKRYLIKNVVDYIQSTQTLSFASEKIIIENGYHKIITIKKVSDTAPNEIMIFPIDFISTEGISLAICNQVKKALNEKKRKLLKIIHPKIVLLYDSYGFYADGFGDLKRRQNCIAQLSSVLSEFHTVFWVTQLGEGFVLSSDFVFARIVDENQN